MAAEREPPPLGDGKPTDFEELEEGEDLFTSTVSTLESSPSSPEPASLLAEDVSTNSNGPKPAEVVLDDDREDLFAEATEEVSLDSPEREPIPSSEPSPAVTPVTPTTLIAPRIESKSMSAPVIFDRSREEIEEEANGDVFDIEIGVSDPEKVGDGMNAYMAYRVTTKLPRAVNTQALSGAGILRMVNKAADAVNKMTIKMNESDAWFEEKQQQFENLDQQLRKLHASVEALVCHRKELSANTAAFAKSAAMLGNSEDHTALSRALSQLAEVEEKIDQLHQEQAFADFYMFSELLSDYIRLIAAVKKERVKDFKTVIIKYLESLVQTQQQAGAPGVESLNAALAILPARCPPPALWISGWTALVSGTAAPLFSDRSGFAAG
ncbi:hypothetical protein CB1_001178007 [Camelus ferus]|nr:hypothetical protein CB1_001178007 [Camelus ferus]